VRAGIGADPDDAQQVLGHLKTVLRRHRVLDCLELGGKELDNPATLGTDHVVVMLMLVVVFVMGDAVAKAHCPRDLILDNFLRTEEHLSMKIFTVWSKNKISTIGRPRLSHLKTFDGSRLAREVRFGDGITHYEHNYKHQHHDHMICSQCGRLSSSFPRARGNPGRDGGEAPFSGDPHLLRIIGVCAECRRALREADKAQTLARPARSRQPRAAR